MGIHHVTRDTLIQKQYGIKGGFNMGDKGASDAVEVLEEAGVPGGIVLENLRWKCIKCDEIVDGTDAAYLNFCRKHPKKNECKVELVDIVTGEIIATSLRDAQGKGIFKMPHTKEDSSTGIPRDGQPLFTGYFKTEKVELNGKLFLYREIFVQEKLIPQDTKMGDFLLGAVETLLEMTGRKIGIIQTKEGGTT